MATLDCSIESIHDETKLACRIYRPSPAHPNLAKSTIYGVVIAHPYAPLGGSQDDHVVQAVCNSFLDSGVMVGTFNFRYVACMMTHNPFR